MDGADFFNKVNESADWLAGSLKIRPSMVIVLSGGFGGFVDLLEGKTVFSSSEIPNFPTSKAEGHSGKIVFGDMFGVPVAVMQGRYHYYEGHSPQSVVFPHFVFNKLGAKVLVTTNAVGGIKKTLKPGDIMMIRDHINFMGINPLIGLAVLRKTDQFTSMTDAYSARLRAIAKRAAKKAKVSLKEGVFIATSGPNYETKAEIGMFRKWGADAVGMSTVPEVIAANFLGMEVVSFSCIANKASDLHEGKMTHAEVLLAMNSMAKKAVSLLRAFVAEMK